MRKHILSLLFVVALLVTGKAQERVTVGGKQYVFHTVEKGNTLYSLSKMYKVGVEEIVKENPGVDESLPLGFKLRIPYVEEADGKKNDPNIVVHLVQPKETLYALSKKYDVTIEEILELNPQTEEGLKVGMELRFPKKEAADDSTPSSSIPLLNTGDKTTLKKGEKLHQVKKKETLFGLSKKYDVTIDDLKTANGGLPKGLMVGSEVIIPTNKVKSDSNLGLTPPNHTSDFVQPKVILGDTSASVEVKSTQFGNVDPAHDGYYNVAIMLPFKLDDINPDRPLGSNQIALEFYQGAKLAIDSLVAQGLKVRVYVYDTKKNAAVVREILHRPESADLNLFIGPMYKTPLLEVIDFAKANNVPVVCPVPQSNKILQENTILSKVYASDASQINWLGKYYRENLKGANTFVIHREDEGEKRLARIFKKAAMFGEKGDPEELIPTLIPASMSLDSIETMLKADVENVIFVPSDDLPFVMNTITKLSAYKEDEFKIRVIGVEDWLKFNQLETEDLMTLHVTIPSATFIDYNNEKVKGFIKSYRAKYNAEPNKYGHLGFDVTYFYVQNILMNGIEDEEVLLAENKVEPTSSRFILKRIFEDSGLENIGAFVLEYKDFELKLAY